MRAPTRISRQALESLSRNYRMAVVLESARPVDTVDARRVFEYLAPRLQTVPGVLEVQFRLRPELGRSGTASFRGRPRSTSLPPICAWRRSG
ncbi:MAG: hypothetical protein AB7I33_16010 [Gemmatimonadales bacterium]